MARPEDSRGIEDRKPEFLNNENGKSQRLEEWFNTFSLLATCGAWGSKAVLLNVCIPIWYLVFLLKAIALCHINYIKAWNGGAQSFINVFFHKYLYSLSILLHN